MLHHAVVIAGDGARADIAVAADLGIADIAEMVDLGALADPRLLDLDEIADPGILGQFGAGAQPGIGSDHRAARHVTAFEMRECTDPHAGLDGDAGAEDHVRLDQAIPTDRGIMPEMHGLGRDQRDAVFHRLGPHARLERGLGDAQFDTAVDAHGLGFGAGDGGGRQTARAGKANDIGQVVFARGVVVADLRDQIE